MHLLKTMVIFVSIMIIATLLASCSWQQTDYDVLWEHVRCDNLGVWQIVWVKNWWYMIDFSWQMREVGRLWIECKVIQGYKVIEWYEDYVLWL